jgi:hypothetical protein
VATRAKRGKPEPWQEYAVSIRRLRKGEKGVDPKDPENLGLRTKFGGTPDWDQQDEHPACRTCKTVMNFVGQIDSFEHESKHNPNSRSDMEIQDFMFVDVGMIYVFYCIPCGTAEAIVQYG